MLKFKSRRGEVAALLTLGLVLVGTLITLGTSLFVSSKKTNLASNSRAAEASCTVDQGTEISVANSSSISCATSCTNGGGQYNSSTWTENNEYHCCCKGSSGGGDDGGNSNATMTCSGDCITGSSCTCNGEKGTCSSSGDCEVFNICLGDCVTGSSCTCNGEQGTCNSNGNCAIDSGGGEDPPASSNGVPYPDKACCFCKDDSITVYAKASARVNNDMSTPCTTAKYGTAYGASSWGYCTDTGKNYEGETCGGSGGGEDTAATGGCKDDKLTCDSGNFSYSYSTAGVCASASTRDTNKCYGTQSNCNKYTYDEFYASKCGGGGSSVTIPRGSLGGPCYAPITYPNYVNFYNCNSALNCSKQDASGTCISSGSPGNGGNSTVNCQYKSSVCNSGNNIGKTFYYYQNIQSTGVCASPDMNSSLCWGKYTPTCNQSNFINLYNSECGVTGEDGGTNIESCTGTKNCQSDENVWTNEINKNYNIKNINGTNSYYPDTDLQCSKTSMDINGLKNYCTNGFTQPYNQQGTCTASGKQIHFFECNYFDPSGAQPCSDETPLSGLPAGCTIFRNCPSTDGFCGYECYYKGNKTNCIGVNDQNNEDLVHIFNSSAAAIDLGTAEIVDDSFGGNEHKTVNIGIIKPGETKVIDISKIGFSGYCTGSTDTIHVYINNKDYGSDGCAGGVKIFITLT